MPEMIPYTLSFCGPMNPPVAYEDARFVVVPVPYDHTCTYGTGARFGPRAILEASANIELYDEFLDCEPYRAGVWTHQPVEPVATGPKEMMERVRSLTAKPLDDEKTPIILGGEHGVSLGAVRACRDKEPSLSVLVIDAHADLRAEYQGSPYSHACVQRRFLDWGCPLVQIGIRSLSAEEAEVRRQLPNLLSLTVQQYREVTREGIEELGSILGNHLTDKTYVSIDLDGLDPSIMPATGTPEPGGLLWEEITDILAQVWNRATIVGADIVELEPIPGMRAPDVLAARIAYRLMGLIAAKK